MNKKPNKWLAAILGLVSPLLSMLYVAEPGWAVVYFVGAYGVALLAALFLHQSVLLAIILLLVGWGVPLAAAFHSYQLARDYPDDRPRPRYSRGYSVIGMGLGVFAVIFGFRAFLFEPFKFPSLAMVPTIESGSFLVVQKWGYGHYGTYGVTLFHNPVSSPLVRGDLVAFEAPHDRSITFAQRLIGLPGDKVAYRGKQLSINGKLVTRGKEGEYHAAAMPLRSLTRYSESLDAGDYSVAIDESVTINIKDAARVVEPVCTYEGADFTCEVPAGHYFMMGDNRDNSNDSRYWGFLPADHIVGKVVKVLRFE